MEKHSSSDQINCELNKIHIALFFKDNSKLKFLLKKSMHLKFIENTISKLDNSPIFCFARTLTVNYNALFLGQNIKDLEMNEFPKNIFLESDILYKDLMLNSYFEEASKLVTREEMYLYRLNSNEIIYFIEIPPIKIQFLNETLKKLNINEEFEIFTKNESDTTHLSETVQTVLNNLKDTDLEYNGNEDLILIISCDENVRKFNEFLGNLYDIGLFQGFLRNNKEIWKHYCTWDHFPSDEILSKAKAIIFPGSTLSVTDDKEHLRNTEEFIRKLVKNYPKLKILGVCFGHQIIASAFGAKVGGAGEANQYKFNFGETLLQMEDFFWDLDFVKKSNIFKKNLCILETHGDEVKEVPLNAVRLAKSNSCQNEIFLYGNQILTIQGHPELEGSSLKLRLYHFYPKEYQSVNEGELTLTELRKIIYSFINSN